MNYKSFENWCKRTKFDNVTAGLDKIEIVVPTTLYSL